MHRARGFVLGLIGTGLLDGLHESLDLIFDRPPFGGQQVAHREADLELERVPTLVASEALQEPEQSRPHKGPGGDPAPLPPAAGPGTDRQCTRTISLHETFPLDDPDLERLL
jgi:hypothetical protein